MVALPPSRRSTLARSLLRVRTFFSELRRRRVFRATGVYVVVAFGVLQGVDILMPALDLPDWTMTLLVVLAIVGFPLVVGLAWAFDVVPGPGVRRTPRREVDDAGATPPDTRRPVPVGRGDPADRRGRAASAEEPADGRAEARVDDQAGETDPEATDSAPDRRRRSDRQGHTVAVVPFVNMGGDPENELFVDGITEDVIAHLSKIRAFKVISRTSIMQFKDRRESLHEIAERLNATVLLNGSVRRVGDRVRIVAELVDAYTDQHLWAETYDRRLTDVFSIQTEVALRIANALEAELSSEERRRIRKEPTTNLEAYRLYLKGRHTLIQYTPEAMHRAIRYFQAALDRDPGYALPHVGIANAYAELAEAGALPTDVARPRAMSAAASALRLDPQLGEAHCVLAHLRALWDFDWSGAEAGFRRALELSPNSADVFDLYGRMCGAMGRLDEALALQRRAQELDPLAHRMDVATTLLRAGRWAEAAEEAAGAAEFEPDSARAHASLGWALLKQGRVEEGLAGIERAVDLSPDNPQWLAQLGQAFAVAGREDEARRVLGELESRAARSTYVAPYHLAYIHTGLGEHDRALDLLERAIDERAAAIHGIAASFLFAPLRSHPRFRALLARINLDPVPPPAGPAEKAVS